jgi:hypothetical protein
VRKGRGAVGGIGRGCGARLGLEGGAECGVRDQGGPDGVCGAVESGHGGRSTVEGARCASRRTGQVGGAGGARWAGQGAFGVGRGALGVHWAGSGEGAGGAELRSGRGAVGGIAVGCGQVEGQVRSERSGGRPAGRGLSAPLPAGPPRDLQAPRPRAPRRALQALRFLLRLGAAGRRLRVSRRAAQRPVEPVTRTGTRTGPRGARRPERGSTPRKPTHR